MQEVRRLDIHRRDEGTRQPIAGRATFTDGKTYDWQISSWGKIIFLVEGRFSKRTTRFISPKREAALLTLIGGPQPISHKKQK